MTSAIPTVQRYMTASPVSIGLKQSLAHAHHVMREHRIRHLPVLDGGVLVGLVSQRDLHLIETLKDVEVHTVSVEEAMTSEVYAVAPDAPLDQVAEAMATRKLGSVVVMSGAHVVGIFTNVDACRALTELLRGQLAE
jgi:acetoin utilization protein AcuB